MEALLVIGLGVLIAWQSRRTPRFVFVTAAFTTLLCGASLMAGRAMTSPEYLSRPGPSYPLEEYPFSFGRIIPFSLLFWTLPVVIAVAHGPRLIRRMIGKRRVRQ